MNHDVLGAFIVVLGIVELLAAYLKLRWWIFTRNERRVLAEQGEDTVFRRRYVAGITGLVVGIITVLFGNF